MDFSELIYYNFYMEKKFNHVIIGASRAGLTAAMTIREKNPSDRILIINKEDRLPYKRTELTKKLAGGFKKDDFALLSPGWYEENSITLLNQTTAERIDPSLRSLLLSTGETVFWEQLLIATGAVPSHPAVPGIEHVLHLRNAAQAEKIREGILGSRKVLILGQGVEGIELAEQCRLMNRDAVVTGMDDRLMKKWLDPALSARLLNLVKKNGVDCVFDAPVIRVEYNPHADYPYTLISGGSVLKGDLILASLGIKPDTGLTASLGINGPSGIAVNTHMETILPGIYAAGDVVEPSSLDSYGLWHAAEYQGRTAGLNMAGIPSGMEDHPARMKCEVFGDFFFSMCLKRVCADDRETGWDDHSFMDSRGRYLKLFIRDGKTIAALMAGMKKPGAKALEKGVRQKLSPPQILKWLCDAE